MEAFHRAHEARYGFARRGWTVEAVTLRVEATAPGPPLPARALPTAAGPEPPAAGRADVVYQGERLRAARYAREMLLACHRIRGPAIVTEYSATTWLPPGWEAEVLPSGALLATRP